METRLQQQETPACLWMQAGVVRQKQCRAHYECNTCRFDIALRRFCLENKNLAAQGRPVQGKKGQLVYWKDKLSKQPLSKRPCIHCMKGNIDFKICPKSYHCIDCEFDQYFHDQFKVFTVMQPVGFEDISGVSLPVGYYLHKGHTWLKVEDKNNVRIGMDDFASRLLGTPDAVETLLIGKPVVRNHNAFSIYRETNKASFLSPVNGVITQVNPELIRQPGLLNQAPYTDGWILNIYCSSLRTDLKELLFMDSATAFMNAEVANLYEFLERETGLMAADGGSLGFDLYGNLPDLSWESLLKRFIHQAP
jgi:glycine cleavage system H lipoate-binding protein